MSSHLLVFDLDDTLYPERDYVLSGFAAVSRFLDDNFGITGFGFTASRIFNCGQRTKVFDRALSELGVDSSLSMVSQLVDVYRSHTPEVALSREVADVLSSLGRRNRLALLTDGFAFAQRLKIASLEISGFFEEILVTGEHPPSWRKPGVEGFEYLQSIFDAAPKQALYIGDNPSKDFEGPLSLGWGVARIRLQEGVYSATPTPKNVMEFRTLRTFHDWFTGI